MTEQSDFWPDTSEICLDITSMVKEALTYLYSETSDKGHSERGQTSEH